MVFDDAKSLAQRLSELNLAIWDAKTCAQKEVLRAEFRQIYKQAIDNGYKVRRYREFDISRGYKVPKFKISEDGSKDFVNIVDNRAPGGNHHGDCTTRCICFCTGEDYLTIQREQMANVAKTKASYWEKLSWRSVKVWSQSLLNRGFCELQLPRKVSRKVFLKMFKDSGIDDGIIATKSSGHVAAIDMKSKKILDTWNSAGGRITSIFVPVNQKLIWTMKINSILG